MAAQMMAAAVGALAAAIVPLLVIDGRSAGIGESEYDGYGRWSQHWWW